MERVRLNKHLVSTNTISMCANIVFLYHTKGCWERKHVPLTDCPPTKQADRLTQVHILVRVHVRGAQTRCHNPCVTKCIEENLSAKL
jgi:hypothetical protein